MLGVPIHPDGSDSQDLQPHRRVADLPPGAHARRGDGADPAADRGRGQGPARRPARLLHVPAPGLRPLRPGAGGPDLALRRRARLLRRRPRPAAAVAARDRRRLLLLLRAGCGRRRRHHRGAQAAGPGREGVRGDRPLRRRDDACTATARCRRCAPRAGASARGSAEGDSGLRGRDPHRRPARGRRDPRLHERRPVRAGEGGGPRAGRLRLAARGHEAGPADGGHGPGADRLPRLRRPARLPLARAPEPGRLLQGVGGGGDQPGHRPRARGGALLVPRGARRAALAARDRPRARHDRGRLPDPVRRSRRARPALGRDLPRDRARAQDLPARGPLGGLPRPQRRCSTSRAWSPRTRRAPSSASSRRPPPPSAAAPSWSCSPTAPPTRATAASSTHISRWPRWTWPCAST